MKAIYKTMGLKLLVVILLASPTWANAQSAASYFKGKEITIHIGSSPGGSVDITARTLAPFLAKYTGANIIATNGPLGGQGRGTFNYIVKKAKRNGLSFGWHIGAAAAVYQMYGVGVDYDLRTMTWIGIAAPTRNSLIVNGKKYPTLDALKKAKRFFLAGGAKQSVDSQQGMVALEALGVSYRLVTGYQGTGPIRTAILRGEVDGMARDYAGSEGEIRAGNLAALVHLGPDRDPRLPNVPTVLELGHVNEPFKTLMEATAKAGYFMVGAPEIPADRVRFLREAFKKAVQDPDFVKRATKEGFTPSYGDPDETEKVVANLLSMPQAQKEKIFALAEKASK